MTISVPIGFYFLFTDIGAGGPLVMANLKELAGFINGFYCMAVLDIFTCLQLRHLDCIRHGGLCLCF